MKKTIKWLLIIAVALVVGWNVKCFAQYQVIGGEVIKTNGDSSSNYTESIRKQMDRANRTRTEDRSKKSINTPAKNSVMTDPKYHSTAYRDSSPNYTESIQKQMYRADRTREDPSKNWTLLDELPAITLSSDPKGNNYLRAGKHSNGHWTFLECQEQYDPAVGKNKLYPVVYKIYQGNHAVRIKNRINDEVSRKDGYTVLYQKKKQNQNVEPLDLESFVVEKNAENLVEKNPTAFTRYLLAFSRGYTIVARIKIPGSLATRGFDLPNNALTVRTFSAADALMKENYGNYEGFVVAEPKHKACEGTEYTWDNMSNERNFFNF